MRRWYKRLSTWLWFLAGMAIMANPIVGGALLGIGIILYRRGN